MKRQNVLLIIIFAIIGMITNTHTYVYSEDMAWLFIANSFVYRLLSILYHASEGLLILRVRRGYVRKMPDIYIERIMLGESADVRTKRAIAHMKKGNKNGESREMELWHLKFMFLTSVVSCLVSCRVHPTNYEQSLVVWWCGAILTFRVSPLLSQSRLIKSDAASRLVDKLHESTNNYGITT